MANTYDTQPIFIDTDMGSTGFREEAGALANQQGLFVNNIIITQNGMVADGTIVITDPTGTSPNTLLQIPITTSTVFPIIIPFTVGMQWKDFAVNGQATTKTALQIWYR